MAWSSPPYPLMSMIGEARLLRHVYLPALTQSYIVWTAELWAGGSHFIISPMTPEVTASGTDDKIIAGPYQVKDFTVWETTPNVILILYEDNDKQLWALTYNVATQSVVSGPTKKYAGQVPSMATDGLTSPIVSYVRGGNLKMRKTLDASEYPVVTPSASSMIDHDTHEKNGTSFVVRYAGLHGQNPDVARGFVPTSNTRAAYDSGDFVYEDATYRLRDESGNDCDLNLNGGIPHPEGVLFTGTFTPSAAGVVMGSGLTVEAWLWPTMSRRDANLLDGSAVKFGFLNTGKLVFQFYYSGSWITLAQTSGRTLDPLEPNYVALSHVWGTGSSVFMVINGSQVPCSWVVGTGNENPGLASIDFTMTLANGDLFKSMAISDVAKTLSSIIDYTKGKV